MKATATRESGFRHTVKIRSHELAVDERAEVGGTDTAPEPLELLAASLASCTAVTMEMYAQRKEWPLEGVDVKVDYTAKPTPSFVKHITMRGPLDDRQKARMLEIAELCPVAKLLKSGVAMESRLAE